MRPAPGAAPKGAFVAVAATSSSASQPRILPAVLEEQPAAQATSRDKPAGGHAAKTATQSRVPRRAKALDDLIARVVASR
jgi:hypothetical protein